MTTIPTPTTSLPASPTTDAPAITRGDIGARLAGIGAIGFAAVVVAQNALRGGSAPGNGASPAEVLEHYADHRGLTVALVALFVAGGAALSVFLGGAMRRMLAGPRRGWALTGGVGAVSVIALFALVVAAEQALSVVAAGTAPDLAAVEALWALHNSVFTVLQLALAIALVGLSRAGVAAGITPPAFERLAPAGAALLVLAAVAGPFVAAGEAMPFFGLGGLGFLIWLAFLVTTGRRLVREAS